MRPSFHDFVPFGLFILKVDFNFPVVFHQSLSIANQPCLFSEVGRKQIGANEKLIRNIPDPWTCHEEINKCVKLKNGTNTPGKRNRKTHGLNQQRHFTVPSFGVQMIKG